MEKTVLEVSRLCGISVRTLHYYDEIGLLRPARTTGAGYRLYGDAQLARLQQILFFKELDFPLREISAILQNPDFDPRKALENHRALLMQKRGRLEELIGLVDKMLKGDATVKFEPFDNREIEAARRRYAAEAQERWGGTAAFAESEKRTKGYSGEDWARITARAGELYAAFAAAMPNSPGDPAVQKLVSDWQQHITAHFYNCTDEILAGLGELYVSDERFTRAIDQNAAGLAKFMSDAIAIFCARKE